MFGRWGNRDEYGDLARALRHERPQPPLPLVRSIGARVAGAERPRDKRSRAGLALALTVLAIVTIASFGGVGYARSVAHDAIRKVDGTAGKTKVSIKQAPTSAQAQYGAFTSPTGAGGKGGGGGGGSVKPPKKTSGGGGGGGSARGGGGKGGASSGASGGGTAGATAGRGSGTGTAGTSGSNLPFTGLALWIPMLFGVVLIGVGLILRGRGRRREPAI